MSLLESARKQGKRVKALEDRPSVHPALEWVYDAFWHLSTCRSSGFGVGPIPWTAIDAYARRKRIEDFERFERLIDAMDSAYLEGQAKPQDQPEVKHDDRNHRAISRPPAGRVRAR